MRRLKCSSGCKNRSVPFLSLSVLLAGAAFILLSADPEIVFIENWSPDVDLKENLRATAEKREVEASGTTSLSLTRLGGRKLRLGEKLRRMKALERKRPTMHTFYYPIIGEESVGSLESRAGLLSTWAKAWYAAGWKPRILTMADAQRHSDYRKYRDFLDTNPWGAYNTMCFWRWFAMATVEKGGWMSDFDVFPLNTFVDQVGDNLPNEGNLTTHEWFVPGLVSGTMSEYTRVAKLIVENAEERKQSKPKEHWSDMHALGDLRRRHTWGQRNNSIVMSQGLLKGIDLFEAAPFDESTCDEFRDKIAVHFAHFYISQGLEKGLIPEELNMEKRVEISQEWVGKWREVCNPSNRGGGKVSIA